MDEGSEFTCFASTKVLGLLVQMFLLYSEFCGCRPAKLLSSANFTRPGCAECTSCREEQEEPAAGAVGAVAGEGQEEEVVAKRFDLLTKRCCNIGS